MNFKTYVNPTCQGETYLTKALNIFIRELSIDPKLLGPEEYLVIHTSGINDNIVIDNKHTFSKKKFITNKLFKHKLEEYYNEHNIYVDNPFYIGNICFLKLSKLLRR